MSGELWQRYATSRSVTDRNRLVVVYAPLVKWVVGRLPFQVRQHVEGDDLVGFGMIGLIDAVERFDPAPGFKFETYAIRRVRGAIFDELRRIDTLPRGVRDKAREIETARSSLEQSLGRPPTRAEVAAEAKTAVASVVSIAASVATGAPVSLEAQLAVADVDPASDVDDIEAAGDRMDAVTMSHRLRDAAGRLPERERKVIALYYLEGLTLLEIGSLLGVTESRVCQLRSRGVLLLRSLLDHGSAVRTRPLASASA